MAEKDEVRGSYDAETNMIEINGKKFRGRRKLPDPSESKLQEIGARLGVAPGSVKTGGGGGGGGGGGAASAAAAAPPSEAASGGSGLSRKGSKKVIKTVVRRRSSKALVGGGGGGGGGGCGGGGDLHRRRSGERTHAMQPMSSVPERTHLPAPLANVSQQQQQQMSHDGYQNLPVTAARIAPLPAPFFASSSAAATSAAAAAAATTSDGGGRVDATWSIGDVGAWLRRELHASDALVDAFAAQDIDGEVLVSLSQDDLTKLGCTLGIARKILNRVK